MLNRRPSHFRSFWAPQWKNDLSCSQHAFMDILSAYFAHYSLLGVFAVVLVKQRGAPLPASPVLVLAGAVDAPDALFGVAVLVVASTPHNFLTMD